MKKILGEKIGMTRIFDENNKVVPVSIINIPDNKIIHIQKNKENKLYYIQIGYGNKKNITKPLSHHLKKANLNTIKHIKQFTVKEEDANNYKVGNTIDITSLENIKKIQVSGISKGKGFAGVMKRHGFSGMPASHGHEKQRIPGSIGCRFPQRTIKGKRMAGHMGVEKITVKNLKVIDIDKDKKLIAIKGAIPGIKNNLIEIGFK